MKNLIIISLFFIFPSLALGQDLNLYLEEAAENNPGLKASFNAYLASLERVDQVKPLPDPQLAFGYFISPVETRVGPQQAKISISQMFPWFGTNSKKASIAELEAKAKYENFVDLKNELYYDIKIVYFELSTITTKIRLNEENLEILRSLESITTSKFESGQSKMVDVVRVQMMIDDQETELKILRDSMEPLIVRFNTLLNREKNREVVIEENLALPEFEPVEQDSMIFQKHPEVMNLDYRFKIASAQEDLASLTGSPEFGIGLDYVVVGERDEVSMTDNGKNALMPMLTLSLPIYRNKYKAAEKEAVLEQESIKNLKRNVVNNLQAEYSEAEWELERSVENINLYKSQIDRADQAYTLLARTFSTAGEDFVEVLRMLQQKLKYQLALTDAEKEYLDAYARIEWITANNL